MGSLRAGIFLVWRTPTLTVLCFACFSRACLRGVASWAMRGVEMSRVMRSGRRDMGVFYTRNGVFSTYESVAERVGALSLAG